MKSLTMICTVAGLAFAAASSANAVAVIGAKTIHITSAAPTNDDYIQVSELVATQYGTGTDVALATQGGVATALNDYGGDSGPGAAIDGVSGTDFPAIYHSVGTPADYLDITLATPDTLSSLTIYGRNGCCQERDIYNVSIFNATGGLLYSGVLDDRTDAVAGATVTFSSPAPEPATWAMMVLGVGGLGAMARRSRRVLAAA